MSGFDDLGEGARKVFLAGIGAIAMGAEKSQELVEELVQKGELTVEQGKAVNEELRHKVSTATDDASDALLRAKLRSMTPEERASWITNAQSIASDLDAQSVTVPVAGAEGTAAEAADASDAADANDAADASDVDKDQ